MLWRSLQDWRDRRRVLRELKRNREDDERTLVATELNSIRLAKLALDSGDRIEASTHWETALARMPNAIIRSELALEILIGLKRYDEAEALMRKGQRRAPLDRHYPAGLAHIAERRGDHAEALRRWTITRQHEPGHHEAWLHSGICLRFLDRFDEAEAMLEEATRLASGDLICWIERARISDLRQDWEESVVRWRVVAERFRFVPGFLGCAKALIQLDRLNEADTMLGQAPRGGDLEIAETRGHLARRRGDLAAAVQCWAKVREIAPNVSRGYQVGAICLAGMQRHAEADAVMLDAIGRFPDEAWPVLDFARLAHDRRDWDEAASRWETLRRRFPDQEAGHSKGTEALQQCGRGDEAAFRFRN